MANNKQPSLPALPRLVVQFTEDSEPIIVDARQQDMLLWEETSHKHHWPAADAAPFLVAWFIAWAALRRTNTLPADMTKWEDFKAKAFGVGPQSAASTDDAGPDDAGGGAVFPTDPAPGTD